MKTVDIVAKLQAELPNHNSSFSDTVAISSMVAVGKTVTVQTAVAHGKKTGDAVTITGVLMQNPVVLSVVDQTVTGVTTNAHDLTFDDKITDKYTTANITGTDEALYNGSFQISSQDNRKGFTYELPSVPVGAPTGTIFLNEDRIDGFNGRFLITVTDTTTFTYETEIAPPGLAVIDNGLVNSGLRISRAITEEKAADAYTKQDVKKNWLFVIPGSSNVSNDRSLVNDAVASFAEGTDWRIKNVVSFITAVFFPTTDQLAAMDARDEAEDIAVALYQSLAGFNVPSQVNDTSKLFVTPVGHEFGAYVGSYYVHIYNWQVTEEITEQDCLDPESRAFRDARLIFTNEFDEIIINTNVDLDEVPL